MFGIEWYEILLLLRQFGLALAGAAALWGFVFSLRDYSCGKKECIIYDWIAGRLNYLITGGVLLALTAYVFLTTSTVLAHEGVVVVPEVADIARALFLINPIFLLVVFLTTGGFILYTKRPAVFDEIMTPLYGLLFVLFFVLTAFPAWTGELSRVQLFFMGHGFHSIFTLGTVLVLDYLFLVSKKSDMLKQHIYPLFPTISKVIWVGLGIDFASALLILEYFEVTQKFFFMQTVIGILIINGTILAGPLTKKLTAEAEKGGEKVSGKWQRIANLAGTISVSSWLTITVVDYFAHLNLGYPVLLGGYLALIALLFVGHELVSKIEERRTPPVFIH